jgi:chromosome segregation ATPase
VTGMPITREAPAASLSAQLSALVRQRAPVEWMQWLPLASAAAESTHLLGEAFQSLHLEDQYLLLGLLSQDDAGPLAHLVTLALARSADHIQDDMIRDYLLEDAVPALARAVASLERLQFSVETLTRESSAISEVMSEEFDVAGAILRHHQQLTKLRRREGDGPAELHELCALVREVCRLEAERAVLSRYDEASLRSQRDEVLGQLEVVRREKQELDKELEAVTKDLEERRRELHRAQEDQRERTRQVEDQRGRIAAMERDSGSLQQEIDGSKRREVEMQADLSRLQNERSELGGQSDRTLALLSSERRALNEIRAAASAGGHEQVLLRLEELFCMLPDDQADSTFRRNR